MPSTLANPDRPRRHPPLTPSRSSSASSQDTSPSAPETHETFTSATERFSMHSFLSSSDRTAVSEYHPRLLSHEKLPHYSDDSSSIYKALPDIPLSRNVISKHKPRHSDDHDYYVARHSSDLQMLGNYHPFTSSTQLAAALGPDNVPYTAEIATIPCAGVRISHGSLTGLLAWRLVVSNPLQMKSPRRTWWGTGDNTRTGDTTRHREKVHYGTNIPPPTKHSNSYSEFTHPEMPPQKIWAAASTISLPMKGGFSRHSYTEVHRIIPERPQSAMTVFDFPRYQAEGLEHARQSSLGANLMQRSTAVATNFILDTSLPYSIISRDTLAALGYSPNLFPSPHADPHALEYDDSSESRNPDLIVSLSIQGVTTRARIARPGEASRLGVQYLRDASVSVFFPRDGDGVGPVLYYESARLLRDVPLTITALPDHGRMGKPTLPQRVRALFGLS